MPPKRGKKGADEPAAPPQALVRPSTPNDYQIVATVKTLQQLVNTETKWKNRVKEAQRLNQLTNTKVQKLNSMIDQCRSGIEQLHQEVDDIINQLATPQGFVNKGQGGAPHHKASGEKDSGAPAAAAGGKKGGKGGGGNNADEEQYPNSVQSRKSEQANLMGVLIKAYFNAKRLSKDRKAPKPNNPIEMEGEFHEAVRLSTPVAELLAQQSAAAAAGGGGGITSPGANAKAKGGKSHASPGRKDTIQSQGGDESIGELCPEDIQILPTPRGIDPELMEYILLLRSRRLRLENSIEIFERELKPLHKRLDGVDCMRNVGNYSLSAVQPKIQEAVEEEANLQKVRQMEDEQFAAKPNKRESRHK